MKIYRIKNWDRLYENNRSRTVKSLAWVPVPNKHDGEGYCTVMSHPKAAEIFTAWVLMLQVASRCHPRGTLVRDNGTPLTPEALAVRTRGKAEWFAQALEFLAKEDIGWIEATEEPAQQLPDQPDTTLPPDCQAGDEEGKGREENEGKSSAAGAAPASDEEWLASLQSNEAYKGIDVKGEYAKMVNWCQVKGKQPTRRYFINWLNHAGQSAHPVWVQIKNLEEKLMKHPANRESIYFKRDCTDAQKAEFAALKAKLAQLKEQNG